MSTTGIITPIAEWTALLKHIADGDALNGENFLEELQGIANRLEWLKFRSPVIQTYAATGSVTKPPGFPDDAPVTAILIGGGGGGAGGNSGSDFAGGGGGGSGFPRVFHLRGSDFDGTETVTIGAGGVGGAGNSSTPASGAAGGETILTLVSAEGSVRAPGGGGGSRMFVTPGENPNGGIGFHGGGPGYSTDYAGGGVKGGEAFGGIRGQHLSEGVSTGAGGAAAYIASAAIQTYWFGQLGSNNSSGNVTSYGGGSGAPSAFPFFVTGFTAAAAGGTAGSAGGGTGGPGPGAGGGGGGATFTSGQHGNGGNGASGFCVLIWGA